jgi:predicted SprT family Zn-dependent metalloprotease
MIAKLRDTLAHELCHCALWVIDKDPKSHHGKQFKQWYNPLRSKLTLRGTRITKEFPDILVTTKHTYEIEYKYTYTCTNLLCGLDFGRQKKLELDRHVCGACKSRLLQTKPAPTTYRKENKTNPFGKFVKDHFAGVKRENPGVSHKDIMTILSKRYHEQKNTINEGGEGSKRGSQTILVEDSDEEVDEMVISLGILDLE